MGICLDTHHLASGDQLGCWIDLICQTYVGLDCDSPHQHDFHGSIEQHQWAGLDLSVVRSRAQDVRRTRSQIARSQDDCIIVSFQTKGSGVVSQDNRSAVLQVGDYALYDSQRPYALHFDGDFEEIVLKIPRASLGSLASRTSDWTAQTFKGKHGVGQLVFGSVSALREQANILPTCSTADITHGVLSLLAASLRAAAAGQAPAADVEADNAHSRAAVHHARAMQWLRLHLHECELSIADIASAVALSPAQLHRVFQQYGESPAHVLWRLRTHLSQQRLHDASLSHHSISEIAQSCGFSDAAHFSRMFKRRVGMSPRQWRLDHPDNSESMVH